MSEKPNLSLLPEPLREMLVAALAARARAEAEAEEAATRQSAEHWQTLFLAATSDLPIELIPFASLAHKPPADWTGDEHRYAVCVQLPGLVPMSAHYETAANPPGWIRVPGWFVRHYSQPDLPSALLTAYDLATDQELPL